MRDAMESVVQVIAVVVLSYALSWCVCRVWTSQGESINRAHGALLGRR